MAMKLLIKARVAAICQETPRIRRYRLEPVSRAVFPQAAAGDHTILVLPNGMRRAYSLCGDPADASVWEIAVLREESGLGGSRCLHDEVGAGDALFVSWPQPGLAIAPDASRHILIAGGIGVTPFMAMLPELERRGADYMLHMCARSRAELPFAEELENLERKGRARLSLADDAKGRLDLAAVVATAGEDADIYCCGPTRMIDGFVAATAMHDPSRIHIERFTGLSAAEASQGEPFTIRLGRDGPRLQVPANRSMLAVLREAGVMIDALCEGGACGTCKVRFLEGEPIHRDFCLKPTERADIVMACVSRANGELVIAAMP